MIFNKIPENTFDSLILDAGMLLNKFDPSTAAQPADEDIICATTGGVQVSCTATYTDLGEDVDNCPNNMMELKQLEGWECKISTTAITPSLEIVALALGAADIDTAAKKVTPRTLLKLTDFKDVWWVGPTAKGGVAAVHLMKGLSTGGFSLQTGKKTKAQFPIEITGHVSISAQDVVPLEFYYAEAAATPAGET